MSRFILENDILKLEIESYGGEMKSLISKKNSNEYLWCADKKYWVDKPFTKIYKYL